LTGWESVNFMLKVLQHETGIESTTSVSVKSVLLVLLIQIFVSNNLTPRWLRERK
jgi:hypothetical protein